MDLRLLEYIVAIEKYGSMTEAAEKLFITPSALNQQLLRLEKELDVPLFTRSKRRMLPTAAGTVYLDAAKEMLRIHQAAYAQLQDMAGCMTGTYRVGLTYDHGSDVFARIYPVFHRQYPGIQIRCFQLLVPEMLEMLENNSLDMAFLLGGNEDDWHGVEVLPLSEENLLLGLPRPHPLLQGRPFTREPQPAFDLRLLEGDSFALALKKSTMRSQLIDPIFERAGYHPNIMMESSFTAFLEQLTAQGICNTIIPQSQVRNFADIQWFYLPGSPRFRFGFGYAKGYRINAALRCFTALAQNDAMRHLHFNPPPADQAREQPARPGKGERS